MVTKRPLYFVLVMIALYLPRAQSTPLPIEACNVSIRISPYAGDVKALLTPCFADRKLPFSVKLTVQASESKYYATKFENFAVFFDGKERERREACVLKNLAGEKPKAAPAVGTDPRFVRALDFEVTKESLSASPVFKSSEGCGEPVDKLTKTDASPLRDMLVQVGTPLADDETYRALKACGRFLPKGLKSGVFFGRADSQLFSSRGGQKLTGFSIRMPDFDKKYSACLTKVLEPLQAEGAGMVRIARLKIDGQEKTPLPHQRTYREWFVLTFEGEQPRHYKWEQMNE